MRTSFLVSILIILAFGFTHAQTDGDKSGQPSTAAASTISVQKISETVYMLKGKGGNMGLNIGPDGVLLIDSQFAEVTPELIQLVGSRTNEPIKYLVNTHHHGDHSGGNENLLATGTIIYSHDNARKRIFQKVTEEAERKREADLMLNLQKSSKDGSGEQAQKEAEANTKDLSEYLDKDAYYNMITFSDDMTFHFNGEPIMVFHVHDAHTDGDAMVYFTQSNVLHTGDVFFNGKYPYIDTNNGGSVDGYIGAMNKALRLIDDETKIIPGHGELGSKKDLQYASSMLKTLSQRVAYEYVAKKSIDAVLANKDLTSDFDRQGYGDGYISTEKILRLLYSEAEKKYTKNSALKK